MGRAGPGHRLQLGAVPPEAAPRELGAGAGRAGGAVAQHTLALDGRGGAQGQHPLGCWLSGRGDLHGCKGRTGRVTSGDGYKHTAVVFKAVLVVGKGKVKTPSLQNSDRTE